MLSSIVKGVLGAVLSALTDYLKQRRTEALHREVGKLEERANVEIKRKEANEKLREIRYRLANDPDYRERMRQRFSGRRPAAD